MSIENKLAKLYARRPDLAAKEGLYYWETVSYLLHGGPVTELDSNDIFVDCEFCGKECGTEMIDYELLVPIYQAHGYLLPDTYPDDCGLDEYAEGNQFSEDATGAVGLSGGFAAHAPENMVAINGIKPGKVNTYFPNSPASIWDDAYSKTKMAEQILDLILEGSSKKLKTNDPEFIKIFHKKYYDEGHYSLKDLPGFPKGLDLENCEIVYVGDDYIQFRAGGDWQDPVNFSFVVENSEPKITSLFDAAPSKSHSKEVSAYTKMVKELLEESQSFLSMIQEKKGKSPKYETLRNNQVPLTDEEASEVRERNAIWNMHSGTAKNRKTRKELAVWKSVVQGETYYICNTHRAMHVGKTLKSAINAFAFIKTTA